jgi:hypothetical protein
VSERWSDLLEPLDRVGPSEEVRRRSQQAPQYPDRANLPRRRERIIAGVVAFTIFVFAGAYAWHAFHATRQTQAPRTPAIFAQRSKAFIPPIRDGVMDVVFAEGTSASIRLPDLETLSSARPFEPLYLSSECGSDAVFDSEGVLDGVLKSTSPVRSFASANAEGAYLFKGSPGWKPYYIGFSSAGWTALVPCSGRDLRKVEASAALWAQSLSLSVERGFPVFTSNGRVRLGTPGDEPSGPSMLLAFDPGDYLELTPTPRCISTQVESSAGVTEWCLEGGDGGVAFRAEGAPSFVEHLVRQARLRGMLSFSIRQAHPAIRREGSGSPQSRPW